MNYQEALRRMYELLGKIPYEVELSDLNPLRELVFEKLEQETRKDKLIAGSQWECVAICYSEGISFRAPICLVNVKGIVEITEIGESDGIHYVEYSFQNGIRLDEFAIPTQQFLLCFKPIKEGE